MGAPDRLSISRTVLHFIKQQNWAEYDQKWLYNFNKNQHVHYVQYVNLHFRVLWFSWQMTVCSSFSGNKIWNHLAMHFFTHSSLRYLHKKPRAFCSLMQAILFQHDTSPARFTCKTVTKLQPSAWKFLTGRAQPSDDYKKSYIRFCSF